MTDKPAPGAPAITSSYDPDHIDGDVAAWFLGPKAENQDMLERLILGAIRAHGNFRRDYQPDDPEIIDQTTKDDPTFTEMRRHVFAEANRLFTELKQSAPFASMRYHGHMLWDQVMPAMVGYFAAMLYNQNNVAAEASPVTTRMENEVGDQLCALLGYGPEPRPWGHITCDGSVANTEALWVQRNARFHGVAVAAAIREDDRLAAARDMEVTTAAGKTAKLLDLDAWDQINLPLPEVLELLARAVDDHGVDEDAYRDAVEAKVIAKHGMLDFYKANELADIGAPMAFAPATAHYSWPKAATLIGLGSEAVGLIEVDLHARMSMDHLRTQLEACLEARRPVLGVIAVIGSTELSVVDPLAEILEIRDEFRVLGLDFAVHADGAWGGYFAALYREAPPPPPDDLDHIPGPVPVERFGAFVDRQYNALGQCDTITLDPHKSGYAPYPAGALCHRDIRSRDLISFSAPVVKHGDTDPSVGFYGVEGSKPGAAAAGVLLAHRAIGLHKQGYGRLLGQLVWTSKRIYCRLLTLHKRLAPGARPIRITPIQMLPGEFDNQDVEPQIELCAEFAALSTRALWDRLHPRDGGNEKERQFFLDLGSDQVIVGFMVNFADRDNHASWNRCPKKLDALTDAIFHKCSIIDPTEKNVNDVEVMFTASRVNPKVYGDGFTKRLCERLHVDDPGSAGLGFLITTAMNPWAIDETTGDAPGRDHFEVIEKALMKATYEALDELGF